LDQENAYGTVTRTALCKVLASVGCLPRLPQLIVSFHDEIKATIHFDGNLSEFFEFNSGVKQGCDLAPTLFGIYVATLLGYSFKDYHDDVGYSLSAVSLSLLTDHSSTSRMCCISQLG
jgi:hypothetical protein